MRREPMHVDPPTWGLNSAPCACCDNLWLVFSRCPASATIVLICSECSTAYCLEEKRPGKEIGQMSGTSQCYRCAGAFLRDFPLATAEEIQNLGFSAAEYR